MREDDDDDDYEMAVCVDDDDYNGDNDDVTGDERRIRCMPTEQQEIFLLFLFMPLLTHFCTRGGKS